MELVLPVEWDPTRGSRYRLVQRMVMGWSQGHGLKKLLGAVVKEPLLPRLKARDDGMTGIGGVMLSML